MRDSTLLPCCAGCCLSLLRVGRSAAGGENHLRQGKGTLRAAIGLLLPASNRVDSRYNAVGMELGQQQGSLLHNCRP